eukprot:m.702861 g.702861  ORF g.702861 m.702861 type:complete len:304 (-) comp22917_c1_seq11:1876-2787(-)
MASDKEEVDSVVVDEGAADEAEGAKFKTEKDATDSQPGSTESQETDEKESAKKDTSADEHGEDKKSDASPKKEDGDEEEGKESRSTALREKRKRGDDESEGVRVEAAKKVAIDREKRCPFLLRVFVRPFGHNHPQDYKNPSRLPEDELQIYTWPDATLKELSVLVMEVHEAARRKGTRFAVASVFRDRQRQGAPALREIGTVTVGDDGNDDAKELRDTLFKIGDYLDVAIYTPRYVHGSSGNRCFRCCCRDWLFSLASVVGSFAWLARNIPRNILGVSTALCVSICIPRFASSVALPLQQYAS